MSDERLADVVPLFPSMSPPREEDDRILTRQAILGHILEDNALSMLEDDDHRRQRLRDIVPILGAHAYQGVASEAEK